MLEHVCESQWVIFGAALIVSLILNEALRFWMRSFRPDPCKKAVEHSERILEKISEDEDLKTQILLQLREISICQRNTARILEKLVDNLNK